MDASLLGLPAHPLVVHAVVVLLPLSALGAVVMVVRPSFSRRSGGLVVGLAAVGVVAAFVARATGEQLARQVGVPAEHLQWGDRLPWVAVAYLVLLTAFWLVDRGIPSNRSRPGWVVGLAVLLLVAAAGATAVTVLTGHTGAQATWG